MAFYPCSVTTDLFFSIRINYLLNTISYFYYFLHFLAAVFQNHLMIQACIHIFKYNITDCYALGPENKTEYIHEIELTIQPYVARILNAKTLLLSIVPAILCLFIGSWSDKYGRRPVLLFNFSGFFGTFLLLTIICSISTKFFVNPWFYILAFIPLTIGGSAYVQAIGIFGYASDITNDDNRAMK